MAGKYFSFFPLHFTSCRTPLDTSSMDHWHNEEDCYHNPGARLGEEDYIHPGPNLAPVFTEDTDRRNQVMEMDEPPRIKREHKEAKLRGAELGRRTNPASPCPKLRV